MNRDNLPLAWYAATDMSAIGWVMIAYGSNCLISQEWLASFAEGDSIINATLLYYLSLTFIVGASNLAHVIMSFKRNVASSPGVLH